MFRILDEAGNPVRTDIVTRELALEVAAYQFPGRKMTVEQIPQSKGQPGTEPIERSQGGQR